MSLEAESPERKRHETHEKSKSEHRKKRKREEDPDAARADKITPRKQKKLKRHALQANGMEESPGMALDSSIRSSKKHQKRHVRDERNGAAVVLAEEAGGEQRQPDSPEVERKDRSTKKKDKHKDHLEEEGDVADDAVHGYSERIPPGALSHEVPRTSRKKRHKHGSEEETDDPVQSQLLEEVRREKKKAKKLKKSLPEEPQDFWQEPNPTRTDGAREALEQSPEQIGASQLDNVQNGHTSLQPMVTHGKKKRLRKHELDQVEGLELGPDLADMREVAFAVKADTSPKQNVAYHESDSGGVEKSARKKRTSRKTRDLVDEGVAGSEAVPRKHKRKSRDKELVTPVTVEDPFIEGISKDDLPSSKSSKRHKDPDKKKEKQKQDEERAQAEEALSKDSMDLATPKSTPAAPPKHPTPAYPFFTQTISIYVPLYPVGFADPHTAAADQHLKPLLKRYSSLLRGVLLAYRNPRLSEHGLTHSTKHIASEAEGKDAAPAALLMSVGEYAVGFGRLAAEVDLFKPNRGAPMAGTLMLQSEGHVGVVCWGMFNASIESKRLPAGWKWVDLAKKSEEKASRARARALRRERGGEDVAEDVDESDEMDATYDDDEKEVDPDDPFAEPVTPQMHTTGYWVNERGRRVKGRLQFRIKNFDVGLGLGADYGFLSLEGTMLTEDEEKKLLAAERAEEEARKGKRSGLLRPETRRVPEFSMTTFAAAREDQEKETEVVLSLTRPVTPYD